jgi:hypothetical protein
VSATASAAELWSANSSSKKKVKRLLAIAPCSNPAIHCVAYTFCVSKAKFAANHAAIYSIKSGTIAYFGLNISSK